MKKSRLLSEMHETARGLERVGVLDKHTMREFDVLTLPPVKGLRRSRFARFGSGVGSVKQCSPPC